MTPNPKQDRKKIRRTALNRAVEEMAVDIQKYDIDVDIEGRVIGHNHEFVIIKEYAPKSECKKAIRKFIDDIKFYEQVGIKVEASINQQALIP